MSKNDQEVPQRWFKVDLPANQNTKHSYFRAGCPDADYERTFLGNGEDSAREGWVMYTDGDRVTETKGDRYSLTHGTETRMVEGPNLESNNGPFNCELNKGFKLESFFGIASELFVGGKWEANTSVNVSMNLGFEVNYGWVGKYESVLGTNIILSKEIEQEAESSIRLAVDPDDTPEEKWFEQIAPYVFGGAGGLLGAFSSIGAFLNEDGKDFVGTFAMPWSIAIYSIGLINAVLDYKRRKNKIDKDKPRSELLMDQNKIEMNCRKEGQEKPVSQIVMDKDKIELKVGHSSIEINAEGIHLKAPNIVLYEENPSNAAVIFNKSGLTSVNRGIGVMGADIRVQGTIKAENLYFTDKIQGRETKFAMPPPPLAPIPKPLYLGKMKP